VVISRIVGNEAIFRASEIYKATKRMMTAAAKSMVNKMSRRNGGNGTIIIPRTERTSAAKTRSLYLLINSLMVPNLNFGITSYNRN